MSKFTWKTWWGGDAEADAPPQIAAAMPALRRAVGGLKAEKKAGVQFAVKSAKDLMDKLRAAIDNIPELSGVWVSQQNVSNVEVERGTACMTLSVVRVGAQDGSFVDLVGSGHGAATDDKAAGKASTYAWKDALIKGLSLPDAEMVDTDDSSDERPVRKATTASPEEVAEGLAAVAAAKSAADLQGLVGIWRTTKSSAFAKAVGPAIQARLKEF